MRTQLSAAAQPEAAGEKFNILDPATLLRMRERALRWRVARKKSSRVVAAGALRQALATIAATIDLRSGDSIAAQVYSLEAEIARGAELRRIAAGFSRKARPQSAGMSASATLALASGIAAGSAAAANRPASTQRKNEFAVVVALLEGRLDEPCASVLQLASRRKLPLVIVALNGALAEERDETSAYEFHRFPRIPVDRSDPIAIYRVAHEGVERARIGYGPTLVDCIAWPLGGPPGGLQNIERQIVRAGAALPRSSSIERRIESELEGDGREPEVLLFAPE